MESVNALVSTRTWGRDRVEKEDRQNEQRFRVGKERRGGRKMGHALIEKTWLARRPHILNRECA